MSIIGIGLIILVALLIVGVPVALCFLACILFIVTSLGLDPAFLLPCGFASLNSLILLAAPLFILLGFVMSLGQPSLSSRLTDFIGSILRWRGSLGVTTIVSTAIFGAMAGSASSAVAAIGTTLIPQMERHGYSREYGTTLVVTAAVLGQLIPPSVPMILFALVTQQSVTACFLATVGPGILTIIAYSLIHQFLFCPRMPTIKAPLKVGVKDYIKDVRHTIPQAIPVLMAPVLVLGGIYGGLTTPTESAAIGCAYAIALTCLIYKSASLREMKDSLLKTSSMTGIILVMIFFIMILSRIFSMFNIPNMIADVILGMTTNKYLIILMVNAILICIGMLMDDISGTILAAPLLMPIAVAVGISPIQFAAIVGVNLGLGNITPPTAPILYLGGAVGGVSLEKYMGKCVTFMILGDVPVLLAVSFLPAFSLFLPRLLLGIG